MGTVLSLANWIRDSSQWSAAERGRLEALTSHLPGGAELEVVYGAADDGAPWCAVVNEDGDVLVHVARLSGQVLVHVMGEEVVSRGDSLRDALGRWLHPGPELERQGVVVPFAKVRSGMDMMILMAVATLLEEQLRDHLPQGMDGSAWPTATPPAAETKTQAKLLAPIESDAAVHHVAEHEAVDDEAKAPAVAALAPVSPDAEDSSPHLPQPAVTMAATAPVQTEHAPQTVWHDIQQNLRVEGQVALVTQIRGGDGDDFLIGGAEDEHLVGGDGDDVLIGGGGRDVLEGGAGNDQIVLTSEARAYGGAGADSFVISAPQVMDHADTLLGTILDFSAHEGDRLVTVYGDVIVVPPWNEATETHPVAERAFQKIEIDFDGNGRVDGYVLIGDPPSTPAPSDPTQSTDHGFDPCLVSPDIGWSGWTDIIG